VRISTDGLVYVCDRTNDRLQVFRKDGTFLREKVIAKDTFGSGSVWDVVFSTDPRQQFIYINDGTNQLIYVLDRQSLEIVSTFGGHGHMAGQFYGAPRDGGEFEGRPVYRRDLRRQADPEIHVYGARNTLCSPLRSENLD
jgi:hypothetical protein